MILGAEHVACVAVEGTVRSGGLQQGYNGAAGGLDAPGGRPFFFQDIQADLTGCPMNIGVETLRHTCCIQYIWHDVASY